MKKINILSLEDDENLAMVTRHYLEDEGYGVTQTNTGASFQEALKTGGHDIILMDLGLPDVDGLTLIPHIKQHFTGPIIVISGKTDTTDRIVGLELGADDYITKPFEMRELVARIKANLRRIQSMPAANQDNKQESSPSGDKIYAFDQWVYDSSKLSLKHQNGDVVDLTSGECDLLQILLDSNGRVLSREYLFTATRGENFDAFDRSVDIQITRLRKKLHDDPSSPRIIKTVRGVGYMFVAEIQ